MLLLHLLVIWQIQPIQGYNFNMYHSNNHLDTSCLLYHSRDDNTCIPYCPDIYTEQIMSYCFRPAEDDYSLIGSNFQSITNSNITFAQLRQNGITSEILLAWSAPIDIAERYQIFLETYSSSSFENEFAFYNCTSPWFGPFCRFALDNPYTRPLKYIVDHIFSLQSADQIPKKTCYIHITCQTLVTCLDWREICDGKQDCVDGEDEKNCWELEMNECSEDEYRCSNGQCIPWVYFLDGSRKTECLDRTDEYFFSTGDCYKNPMFRCEEHTCRRGLQDFPCGDGECVDEISQCKNRLHHFFSRNFCTNATLCVLKLYEHVDEEWCRQFCAKNNCVKNNCSTEYEFRNFPLLFGHVHFVVSNETIHSNRMPLPDYICYNATLCPHFPSSIASFQNWTCHHVHHFGLRYTNYTELTKLIRAIKSLFSGCLSIDNEAYDCSLSTMYQCINSTKCISKHRLLDGIEQCPFGDDETYSQSCSLSDIRQRYRCKDEIDKKCVTFLATQRSLEGCGDHRDAYENAAVFAKTSISFQMLCDGFTHLLPMLIDGQNETDETGCEFWECNNTYSRCDEIWLCKNGADEVDCRPSTCPTHHHRCIFLNDTSNVSCLPIERAGNDIDDCVGGTDEQTKNNMIDGFNYQAVIHYTFRCRNDTALISIDRLCDNEKDCPLNDDETLCEGWTTLPREICWSSEDLQTDVENFLCQLNTIILRDLKPSFKLHNVLTYPLQLMMDNAPGVPSAQTKSLISVENQNENLRYSSYSTCNRGIYLRYENAGKFLCLCPPSYYGDQCQYQNQRVSLTLQVQLTSDWRTIFVFLLTLIDTQTNIESHEHLEYISTRDCLIKYNIYLLYGTRPKNSSKIYSVRIDAFIGMTLKYRSSWIFPLRFTFLPVHRLSVVLRVPFSTMTLSQDTCSSSCIHGQCLSYVNDQNSTFCHCESGWAGIRCDMKLKCECASDAVCISNSICLCPPGRFGPRCHLSYFSPHFEPCMNGGYWVPVDARYVFVGENSSICVCPEGYIGDRCEHQQQQTQIDISFHHKISIPPSLLIHLIAVPNQEELDPNRTSIAKKLQFDQSLLTVYTTTSFNIVLAQVFDHYYLIVLHEKIIRMTHISTEIIPNHQCRSLAELFNSTVVNQHLLRRIKLYHLPCKQHRELICFYDDVYICLCTLDRSVNCLEFDHSMTYECEKAKYCGDKGQCFQDDHKCPTLSFCACNRCYFGSRCQFSTKGSTLSLDIILGYHIRLKNSVSQQPRIVKSAIAFTSIIFAFGMINGLLSFQTFRRKETRHVGCGLYLLTTSIVSMITVVILALKFVILVATQIGSIRSHRFLSIQCISMDFVVRSLLSISDWLSACVAIERAVSVIQGVKFSKIKSKCVARWVVVMVILLTSCSYLYDPILRRVMNDEEEQQTWCVTEYSPSVQMLDWIVNIVYFTLPFVINGISALLVIITITRTRVNVQKSSSFKEHLREQLHHHKHLIISPLILVALAIPRLIISFLSGCMGSARESWLYLIGYYISFIPTIMTLFVFILPSELYKKEFRATIKQVWHQ